MQTSDPAPLACYTQPGAMTSVGRFSALLDALPPPRSTPCSSAGSTSTSISPTCPATSSSSAETLGSGTGPAPPTLASSGPGPEDPIDPELAALFDRLAALTQAPDASLADLRQLCEDDRLRVPPEVRNAVRGRLERV
jgi:hypothetical protein